MSLQAIYKKATTHFVNTAARSWPINNMSTPGLYFYCLKWFFKFCQHWLKELRDKAGRLRCTLFNWCVPYKLSWNQFFLNWKMFHNIYQLKHVFPKLWTQFLFSFINWNNAFFNCAPSQVCPENYLFLKLK